MSSSSEDECGGGIFDDCWDDLEGLDERQQPADAQPARPSSKKLWTNLQFPEGMNGARNYDLANLQAAQEWSCPCPDRINCIGADRLTVLALYEHRKVFQTKAHARGGKRDANRFDMQAHYDRSSRSFTRRCVPRSEERCHASATHQSKISHASATRQPHISHTSATHLLTSHFRTCV